MEKLNFDRKTLKKFAITMGVAFFVITLLICLKGKHSILITSVISATFFILGFIMPSVLKPLYILWMKLAFILSWINTRLILVIIFYLVFTPIGIGMKLFRVDLLDRKIDKKRVSYWKKRESRVFNPLDYERQF